MHRTFESPPSTELRGERGTLVAWEPRPDLVVTRITGHFGSEVTDAFVEMFERAWRRGPIAGIHDWSGVTSFDVTAPPRLTAWTLANLRKSPKVVVYTQHPMVSMAVRAAGITLRHLTHVDSEASLVRELEAALSRPR